MISQRPIERCFEIIEVTEKSRATGWDITVYKIIEVTCTGSGGGNEEGNPEGFPGDGFGDPFQEGNFGDGGGNEPGGPGPNNPEEIDLNIIGALGELLQLGPHTSPQMQYLLYEASIDQVVGLSNFIEEGQKSTEAKEFANAAIEAWAEGGEVDFDEQVILDEEFVENECLYNIYKDLGKASTFDQIIKQFDSKFSVENLKFSVNPYFGTKYDVKYKNAMALTNPPATSNMIAIDFNIDPSTSGYIINKPDTFKVVAFIHEVLHANMYRKMLDALIAWAPEAQSLHWTTVEQFNAYLNSLENKYFGIFDYYTRFNYGIPQGDNPNQHQQMAQHYRDVIIQTLTDYDFSLSEEDKVALSWIGLNAADIIVWKNLDPTVKQSINYRITNLKNTAPNACN